MLKDPLKAPFRRGKSLWAHSGWPWGKHHPFSSLQTGPPFERGKRSRAGGLGRIEKWTACRLGLPPIGPGCLREHAAWAPGSKNLCKKKHKALCFNHSQSQYPLLDFCKNDHHPKTTIHFWTFGRMISIPKTLSMFGLLKLMISIPKPLSIFGLLEE